MWYSFWVLCETWVCDTASGSVAYSTHPLNEGFLKEVTVEAIDGEDKGSPLLKVLTAELSLLL